MIAPAIQYGSLVLSMQYAWSLVFADTLPGLDQVDQISRLGALGLAILAVIAFARSWVHTDAELKRALAERDAWMARALETDKRLDGLAETLAPIVDYVLNRRTQTSFTEPPSTRRRPRTRPTRDDA